jgi:hypothetical protein
MDRILPDNACYAALSAHDPEHKTGKGDEQ